jgi:pimeloyl-ACP methyl ester carboxylesterase
MRFSSARQALDARVEGDPAGETVVLLHGFPQRAAAAWSAVWPPLVAAGYRVAMPDQRGYSPGALPAERRAYRMDELVGDLSALLDALGAERAHVVGHDWGGAVAWAAAGVMPERLHSLTAVSTPHPRALLAAMTASPQALQLSYFAFFQLPWLPERALLAGGGRVLTEMLRRSGLAADRTRVYVEAMREPGALTAALNWYRAVPLASGSAGRPGRVGVPTLYIWGSRDAALGRAAATRTADWVSGPYTFVEVPGGSHWIPEEHPDALLDPLLRHLCSPHAGGGLAG